MPQRATAAHDTEPLWHHRQVHAADRLTAMGWALDELRSMHPAGSGRTADLLEFVDEARSGLIRDLARCEHDERERRWTIHGQILAARCGLPEAVAVEAMCELRAAGVPNPFVHAKKAMQSPKVRQLAPAGRVEALRGLVRQARAAVSISTPTPVASSR